MRLVEKPEIRPMHCAAIPYLGQSSPNVRWVDTGSEMPGFDNHVYLSEAAVVEAGRILGLPTREEHQKALEENQELQVALKKMIEAYDDLAKRLQSIEALESVGFSVKKRTGRPPGGIPHERVLNG